MAILNFAAGIASAGPVRVTAYILLAAVAAWSVSYVLHRAIGLAAALFAGESDAPNRDEVTR